MFFHTAVSAALALSSTGSAFSFFWSKSSRDVSFKMSVAESLAVPPAGWLLDDSTKFDKDTSTVTLRIHLVQQDMDKFHELATNIATPGHALYGQHLEQYVIDNMIAPREESGDLVMQWLKSAGLTSQASISPRSDSIVVEASISQVEQLLHAEYSAFIQVESGDVVVRTLEYSLPDVLKGHVDMVQPTTFFGLRAMKSTISSVHAVAEASALKSDIAAVTGCNGNITPKCLENLYAFTNANTSQTAGRMGIAGFLEQWPSKSDLSSFLSSYAVLGNTGQTYSCTLINGGTCPTTSNPGVEANLDTQYARAITAKIPNVYYSVGGSPPIVGGGSNQNEPYLEFLNYLLGLSSSQLPNTVSISYGDDESTVPLSYSTNVCNLFSQLGARGVSVLVASGDSGVGSSCTNSAGDAQFTTSFPAGCPWVTTVGGTDGTSPETGWTGGGGGFSEVFGRPSYQNSAVSSWLTNDKTHSSVSQYFNSSGRAYPDVAAQATNFIIVAGGSQQGVDGTSCASPTFASVIQLLNSQRVQVGKAPLGFLNPWLYTSAQSALNDITSGGNSGCSNINGAGFDAVTGWDPSTGLGTPNYTKLLAVSSTT